MFTLFIFAYWCFLNSNAHSLEHFDSKFIEAILLVHIQIVRIRICCYVFVAKGPGIAVCLPHWMVSLTKPFD